MKKLLFLTLIGLMITACGKDDSYDPMEVEEVDTQAPSKPLNLDASEQTETSIKLTWEASTDNIGVTGYKIYQDETAITGLITETTFTIESLTSGSLYSFYITAFDAEENESAKSNTLEAFTIEQPLSFLPLLSEMGVFDGNLSDLNPSDGVQLYEIHSTLFTDYAHKQRLIRLPNGKSMRYNNTDLLPAFPDNTLISKTFYYNLDERDPSLGNKIIETRIQLKVNGEWIVGDYIWNASQTEATLRETGSTEAISFIDANGNTQNVNYQIPSKQDCFTCHNNNTTTSPIGLKLRNLNFIPSYTNQNQLNYFGGLGLLQGVNSGNTSVLPNWEDENLLIEDRARAYMDVNCAHCHQPRGSVPPGFMLDFRLETAFPDTGIYANRGEIIARFQSTLPTYRMPQLGRTVIHGEALQMLNEYIDSL
ncbi:fibronectin type III domain-containing protein [Aequorivita sp. CIP111184]|uniref:fibronectin type III domain-containing protein n=1 Tax=Aequorivita sp. CIP111184 TaxID=2211356 RepID=UPI000DBBDEF8|nr:fibronectin type III domain-containing protein [Aequorivita sp. CIP111184]SRX54233.1 Chitinase A1 [Aequorivita sp. CIP111184]